MASLHILPSILIGLYIIIETIANLAVGADILDLLLRVCAPDANALCPLKGIQTNRAEGSQAGFVYAVVIKSTHIDFLHIGILMGNVKPPAEKYSTGGLKNTVFSYLSSTPRRWELFGGGFAPLHWHLSHPVCFLTGPRITEVSLSGSAEKLLLQFSRYTVQFRVCRPLLGGLPLL
jgi:hypothetical protein